MARPLLCRCRCSRLASRESGVCRKEVFGMTLAGWRVLVVLGYPVGATDAQAVDGVAAGRVTLVVAGLIVDVFLFYMALSGPSKALLRRWRRRRRTTRSAPVRITPSERPLPP